MALPLLGAPRTARAQLSFSGALESDYRFRGLSLSNGRPALSLSVAYDHSTGLYAGSSALAQETAHNGVQMLGFVEYAGYAMRTSPTGPSLDFGVDNENITEYAEQKYALSYSEVYAGAAWGGLSSHVYYSPDYFKAGARSIYVSVDGIYPPDSDWRVTTHGGVTTPIGDYGYGSHHERYDVRLGVSRHFRNFEAHLAWTGYWPQGETPAGRPAVVFGVSAFF